MSGGLDSTVAAHLLHKQGHRVTGVTLKLPVYAGQGKLADRSYLHEAEQLAEKMGIPHYVIDAEDPFAHKIVQYFIDQYMQGRTPNPCTRCNKQIKWNILLQLADQMQMEYIATGHYARIKEHHGKFVIQQGASAQKDQSYFLWQLTSNDMRRTLLPLGNYDKETIRAIAGDLGFNALANKGESFDVCFIEENDYRAFMRRQIPQIDQYLEGGRFVDESGEIIGKHHGFPFYTVGQRKGLNVALGYPVYVTHINAATNTITLGARKTLNQSKMLVKNTNFTKFDAFPEGIRVRTKIRYRHAGVNSRLYREGNMVRVEFDNPVSAVAPGQSAVFMENDLVVGGGIIFQ